MIAGLTGTAYGTNLFQPAAAALGAVWNPGAAPIGIPAVSITPSASGLGATGYHYSPFGYTDFTQPSPQNALAAKIPDHHWVADGVAGAVGGNWRWNFGAAKTDYWLYPAIDHTPVPDEGLEITLWGSNNGGSSWIQGTVVEVYELGWDLATIPDDGVSRWSFNSPVDIITATPGLTQNQYSYNGGLDYEADAVMQTPEPASICMLAAGSLLALGRRRG